jgi:hypothetical protein
MLKETVQPMAAWATVLRPGTLDPAPRMILALATMPSLLDRALRHGAPQVLATVPLPGVACPIAETSATSTTPRHQVATTLLPLPALTVLLLLVLLHQHLVHGPKVLPRPAELSVLQPLGDCLSVEATMPRPLRPLTHQPLRWVASLPPPVQAMATMMEVPATTRAPQALECFLIPFQFYTVPDTLKKARRLNTAWI